MNNKGYSTKELIIILSVFSIIYFIGVISFSFAFKYDKEESDYEAKISLIKAQAIEYAKDNKDSLFKENESVSLYANDLVKKGYINANESGYIIDPRDSAKNLNDLKLVVSYKDGKYETNIES